MIEKSDGDNPALPAMSRMHVLAVAAVAPEVPGRLFKTLMCLAVLADHRTGLVRPAGRQHELWGIPKSTWHDHIKALEGLGHVAQVALGNHEAGRAAEYQLLLPGAPSAGPAGRTPSRREGTSKNNPCPSPGVGPVTRIHPELSVAEQSQWERLRRALHAGLTAEDRSRLNDDIRQFDQAIPLARTLVRLDAAGHRSALVAALTERVHPGQSVFAGVKHPARALWRRAGRVADRFGVHMFDATPAVPTDSALTPGEAMEAVAPGLDARLDAMRVDMLGTR